MTPSNCHFTKDLKMTLLKVQFLKVQEQVPRPNDEIWLVDVSVWLKPEDAARVKFFYTDVGNKKTRDSSPLEK